MPSPLPGRSVVASLAALCGAWLWAGAARADVPPYQPYEDACAGRADGGACSVNLGMGGYQDGGSGACGPGGSCTSFSGMCSPAADGGRSCPCASPNPQGKCYSTGPCLRCQVGAAPAGTSSSSTSGSGGTSSGSTAGSTAGSTTGGTGTSSGCSGVTPAAAPWLLALLVPLFVRRSPRR